MLRTHRLDGGPRCRALGAMSGAPTRTGRGEPRPYTATATLLLLALVGVCQSVAHGQATGGATPSASAILHRVLDLSQEVKDYTAQVRVSADVQGAPEQMPEFKVYFKRPDKVHIESRSIVIVRRDMLTFGNLAKYIEKGAQTVLLGVKDAGGTPMYTLKLIPKEQPAPPRPPRSGADGSPHRFRQPPPPAGPPRVLVTVNGRRWTIERMDLYEGAKQMATMYWTHVLVGSRYWMPSRIQCRMPTAPKRDGKPGAQLIVTFANYTVNTGLSDSLFVEPKQPTKPPGK